MPSIYIIYISIALEFYITLFSYRSDGVLNYKPKGQRSSVKEKKWNQTTIRVICCQDIGRGKNDQASIKDTVETKKVNLGSQDNG